jgi:secreted trypsin-like serine protease
MTGKDLCIASPKGKGVCNGDSGSPAVVKVGGTWRLIGVASRQGVAGKGCGQGLAVYTNATKYKSWITAHTGALPTG